MPRKAKWPPPIYENRRTGKAFVRIRSNGVVTDRTLGPIGSDEAKAAYERILLELRSGPKLPQAGTLGGGSSLTVLEMVARWWSEHGLSHYAGKPELAHYRLALAVVVRLFPGLPARSFGSNHLLAVQQEFVRSGWCRNQCNRALKRVRTVFRWADLHGHVDKGTWEHLRSVPALPLGAARDTEPVLPVPESVLEATLPHLSRVVRGAVETQLFTGARPGEVLALRPADLLRSDRVEIAPGHWLTTHGVWVAVPERHKTAHRGHRKVILFGPRAQAVLGPFLLNREANSYIFSPREAAEEYLRCTGRRIHFRRKRAPGERYRVESYDRAIAAACRRVHGPWPAGIVCHWHPHQLRHNAASRLAAEFGEETARIVLGHRHVDMTRRYVLRDLTAAVAAVAKVG